MTGYLRQLEKGLLTHDGQPLFDVSMERLGDFDSHGKKNNNLTSYGTEAKHGKMIGEQWGNEEEGAVKEDISRRSFIKGIGCGAGAIGILPLTGNSSGCSPGLNDLPGDDTLAPPVSPKGVHYDYDAIIIGAGVGGLICGCLLAKEGLKTLIVESHYQPGGYVTSFKRGDYHFNATTHVVTDCGKDGMVGRILAYLKLDKEIPFVPVPGVSKAVYPDRSYHFYSDRERTLAGFVEAFPTEKKGLEQYFKTLDALLKEIATLPFNLAPSELPRFEKTHPLLLGYHNRTSMDLLDDHFDNHKLKVALASNWPYGGLPPKQLSAVYGMLVTHAYQMTGGWVPKGGAQAMSDGLARGFQEYGGDLRLLTRVERILMSEGRAMGVRLTQGTEITARDIISNADTKRTYLELLGEEQLPRPLLKHIKQLELSLTGFCCYLGVEEDLSPLDLNYGTVMYLPTYRFLDLGLWLSKHGPIRPRGYGITSSSLKDPDSGLAPAGHNCLEIILTAAPYDYRDHWKMESPDVRGPRYQALKEKIGDKIIRAVERTLIPGLSKQIVQREFATPLTFERYTSATRGALYDIAHTPRQSIPCRRRPASPIGGLYFTGAKISGGVSGSMIGGLMTADTILEKSLIRGI